MVMFAGASSPPPNWGAITTGGTPETLGDGIPLAFDDAGDATLMYVTTDGGGVQITKGMALLGLTGAQFQVTFNHPDVTNGEQGFLTFNENGQFQVGVSDDDGDSEIGWNPKGFQAGTTNLINWYKGFTATGDIAGDPWGLYLSGTGFNPVGSVLGGRYVDIYIDGPTVTGDESGTQGDLPYAASVLITPPTNGGGGLTTPNMYSLVLDGPMRLGDDIALYLDDGATGGLRYFDSQHRLFAQTGNGAIAYAGAEQSTTTAFLEFYAQNDEDTSDIEIDVQPERLDVYLNNALIQIHGGELILEEGTTGYPSLNIPSGTAPTSPTDGDVWYDGTDINVRVGMATKKLAWQ